MWLFGPSEMVIDNLCTSLFVHVYNVPKACWVGDLLICSHYGSLGKGSAWLNFVSLCQPRSVLVRLKPFAVPNLLCLGLLVVLLGTFLPLDYYQFLLRIVDCF